jgi:hypothetical protein
MRFYSEHRKRRKLLGFSSLNLELMKRFIGIHDETIECKIEVEREKTCRLCLAARAYQGGKWWQRVEIVLIQSLSQLSIPLDILPAAAEPISA